MTIETVVSLAYEHLIRKQYTGYEIRDLIKQHAVEELNLSERDAIALAWKEEPEIKDEIDVRAFQDFYLWYYFNHVAPPVRGKNEEGTEATLPASLKEKQEATLYAVIKVRASIDATTLYDAIHEWESNCYYEIASSDRLTVIETEFIGTTPDRPTVHVF